MADVKEEKAILVDTTKCTACRACQVACKSWNENPGEKTTNLGSYENPPTLSSYTWMRILFNEHYSSRDKSMRWLFLKHQCMHCTDAACVTVCPPNATQQQEVTLKDKTVLKRVATDSNKCIGCNYCRVACPFDVPGYNQKEKGIKRCTLCFDRIENAQNEAAEVSRALSELGALETSIARSLMEGKPVADADKKAAEELRLKIADLKAKAKAARPFGNKDKMQAVPAIWKPACVNVCAPGALAFGNRSELIKKGEARVAELKAKYPKAKLYGVSKEVDGMRYIYVLTDDPEAYGLPNEPSVPVSATVWKALTKPWGLVATAGLAVALVVNGVINARNRGLEEKYKLEE